MKYKERPVVVYFESVNNIKVYKTVKSARAETSEYNYQQLAKRLRETKIVPVDNGFLKMVEVLWNQRSVRSARIPYSKIHHNANGMQSDLRDGVH